MAGSGSIRISEYPKLIDKSYKFAMQEYAATEVVYPEIFETAPPPNFDPDQPLYRGVVGVLDSHVNEDWRPGQPKEEQGGFQDYHYQMRKKYLQSKLALDDENAKVTATNLWNVVSEWMAAAAANHRRKLDKIAADAINNGVLTAGHVVFNNNHPSYDGSLEGPNSLFIYDGQPWFDTAHPESRKNTSDTYQNHDSSLAISRTNFQTVWTRMTVTNAKDRNGEDMDVMPNGIIFNPANYFTVDQALGSIVLDADQQKNTLMNMGLRPIPWRRFTDANGFQMSQLKKGKYLINWGAPYVKTWYDSDTEVSYISLVTPYGIAITDWRFDYQAGTAAS